MHKYTLDDFIRYYRGSWIIHPESGKVVQVMGSDRNNGVQLSDKTSINLDRLDWNHVQTPTLGYRSLDDGKILYYIDRSAGRRTEKGVTLSAITIDVPPIVSEITQLRGNESDISNLSKHANLGIKLAEAIFRPEFKRLQEAIDDLKVKDHAIAFACSNSWAVSIGLHEESMFILHFRGMRVANSKNGIKWKWIDEDAEYIFDRSSIR